MLMIASALPADASATLAQACAQHPEITFSTAALSEIQQFLEADNSNLVLVFMEFAAENLGRVIHSGAEALTTQAESWRQSAEALLDLHKLAPARIYLLSFESIRHTPKLLHSFDIALSLPSLSARNSLLNLLASHWLSNQEALMALDQQLRDSSQGFSETHLSSESALAAAQFSADQSAQLAHYKEENSLLLRQLHLTQEQLAHCPQQTEGRIISITPKKSRSGLETLLQSYRHSRHRAKFKWIERIVRPLLSRVYYFTKRHLQK